MSTKVLATPGVYIEEKSAFPSSVVAVPTAIPAFIGYTEMALRGTQDLTGKPTKINSMAEYVELFGGPPETSFNVTQDPVVNFRLGFNQGRFLLFYAMRFFYSNGGGPCYIVSVGGYTKTDEAGNVTPNQVQAADLNNEEELKGLSSLRKEQEPTMVVIPDAVLLADKNECYSLQKEMIKHCGVDMASRFAVLDVYGGDAERFPESDSDNGNEMVVDVFRNNITSPKLQFSAAYYPWLETTVVQSTELDFTRIANLAELQAILDTELTRFVTGGAIKEGSDRHVQIQDELKKPALMAKKAKGEELTAEELEILSDEDSIDSVTNTLLAVSPLFKDIMKEMSRMMNIMPPSAGIAGVYSTVDNLFGVHKAPANIGMGAVVKPTVNITSEAQQDLNLPLNGKAINAIRTFVGKGTLIWGARTLDGNSQDWRYISVRRSLIMIEQSIKAAAEAYVFEPNDANTWASIKSMLINFLTLQWNAGVLVGSNAADAFSVDIGLGVTMTPVDILDGVMNISVKVAISRPAEFIVITFQQQMQKS